MDEFFGAEDNDRYLAWLDQHPDGYVLQSNQGTDQKLHRASCRWVGADGASPPQGAVWTSYRKRCSLNRQALRALATGERQFCNP
jgi:hypothetical protein